MGIRVPVHVAAHVRALNTETANSRRLAVVKKDSALEAKAHSELLRQFPQIPKEYVVPVLKHTLAKRSGRVGRSRTIPFEECIKLAVRAFARHRCTEYDQLWRKENLDVSEAREKVKEEVDDIVMTWAGKDTVVRSKPPPLCPSSSETTRKARTPTRSSTRSSNIAMVGAIQSSRMPRPSTKKSAARSPPCKNSTSSSKKNSNSRSPRSWRSYNHVHHRQQAGRPSQGRRRRSKKIIDANSSVT